MSRGSADNSLRDLSFAFLAGFGGRKDDGGAAEGAQEMAPTVNEVSNGTQDAAAEKVPDAALTAAATATVTTTVEPPDSASSRETAGQTVILAPGEQLVRVVRAPRRHAWGLAHAMKTIVLAALAICAGSLALTLLMNPDLTFMDAVSLLWSRAVDVVRRIGALIG